MGHCDHHIPHGLFSFDTLRQRIAWPAATLDERRAAAGQPQGVALDAGARARLARWARLFAAGDEAAFRRRLAWDGLTTSTLAAVFSPHPPDGFDAAWIHWLPRLSAESSVSAAGFRDATWETEIAALDGSDIPFADAWLPFIRLARADLRARLGATRWLTPAAAMAFERQLARDLALAGASVMDAAFSEFAPIAERQAVGSGEALGSSRYDGFIRRLLQTGFFDLFAAYPALARHLCGLLETWVATATELARRFEQDRSAIEAAWGRPVLAVTGAVPALSDPHDGGRRVACLEIDGSWRLVYKPRNIGIELAYNQLLAWLRAEGLSDVPGPLTVLAREGHGWVEHASPADFGCRQDLERYYRRAGGLACLAHVLRGRDLHGENIIAAAEGPALIDAEALVQPVGRAEGLPHASAAATGPSPDDPSCTCLETGLLALRQEDSEGHFREIGGLRGNAPRGLAAGAGAWFGLRTDAIGCNSRGPAAPSPLLPNLPRLHGERVPIEEVRNSVTEGFRSTYRFLVEHRARLLAPGGPLDAFASCATRVLFRPSDRYASLLRVLDAPAHWRDGADRSVALDSLNRVFSREPRQPPLWPLVGAERHALEQGDIPRCAALTTGCAVSLAQGSTVEGYFLQSGMDAVQDRLGALEEDDLRRQIAWLEGALDSVLPAPVPSATPAPPLGHLRPDAFRAGALRIAESLLSCASGAGAGPRWPVLGDRLDLYGGLTGPLVFLAAVARLEGGSWRPRALGLAAEVLACLDAPRRAPTGIGGTSGVGSLVYGLAVAGTLLDAPDLIAGAGLLADDITPEQVETCRAFDVTDGVSGALLALLAWRQASGERGLHPAAPACAAWLGNHLEDTGCHGRAWRSPDGCFRAGVGHGATGGALALARFAVATADRAAVAAAREALAFERAVFSLPDRNWPAVRGDGGVAVMTAWCHGAAGIGLGRALMPPLAADASLSQDLAYAAEATMAAGPGRFDHLCCGTFSRVEALLTMGARAAKDEWIAAARALAEPVARRIASHGMAAARTAGFERGMFEPGFFQGLSGIGYVLLRLTDPGALPSVSGFEIGSGRY